MTNEHPLEIQVIPDRGGGQMLRQLADMLDPPESKAREDLIGPWNTLLTFLDAGVARYPLVLARAVTLMRKKVGEDFENLPLLVNSWLTEQGFEYRLARGPRDEVRPISGRHTRPEPGLKYRRVSFERVLGSSADGSDCR